MHGADHPGIVHGIAAALADLEVNVVDLATRVVPGDDGPAYVMVIDVTLPDGVGGDELAGGARRSGRPARRDVQRARGRRRHSLARHRVPVRPVVGLPHAVLAAVTPPRRRYSTTTLARARRRPPRHDARVARVRRASRAADRRERARLRSSTCAATARRRSITANWCSSTRTSKRAATPTWLARAA